MRTIAWFPMVLVLAACGPSGPAGGAVDGPADTHCEGKPAQPVSLSVCHQQAPADAGAGEDPGADYGTTMYGSEGDDDDCKYRISWRSTPVYENTDVTFTVTVTKKADGSPLTGAEPLAEVFLSSIHPAPNSDQTSSESKPGTYTLGPVVFDEAGKWTARFHFYQQCTDFSEESPHGHAAFYVDVP